MKIKLMVLATLVLLIPTSSISKTDTKDTIVLSKDNTISLNAEVNGESTAAVISKAKELNINLNKQLKGRLGLNKSKPLYLFMNTPGGNIQSGLEMIEALWGLDRPVHTISLFSASMGFQIVQNLGTRYILKNGVLMSHRARGGFEGDFGGPSPSQIESRYHLWMSRLTELDEQTVRRTNGKQTLESYQKAYSSELWLTGSESVSGGYADKVVTVKCDDTLDGTSPHSVMFFGMNITYDLDNCPLNTSPMNIRVAAPDTKNLLTGEKIEEIKTKFLEQYEKKQKMVVPMYW